VQHPLAVAGQEQDGAADLGQLLLDGQHDLLEHAVQGSAASDLPQDRLLASRQLPTLYAAHRNRGCYSCKRPGAQAEKDDRPPRRAAGVET
jgi:hypothetical protein